MSLITTVLFLLILCFTILIIVEIKKELHSFYVTHYDVCSEMFSELRREVRVLFLSDLHNRSYGKENEDLLSSIRLENPDLILIGGDMIVGKPGESWDNAVSLIRQLPGICPVIHASGNHEQRVKDDRKTYGALYQKYRKMLEESGVHFLDNERIEVDFGTCSLAIYGLSLTDSYYRKFRKVRLSPEKLWSMFGGAREEKGKTYKILLAHNPSYMEAYLEWGADLVLSGHLHGGLVRLPVIGGVVTPQGFLFPQYSGEMTREGNQTVIVSRGLGTHTMNIRFCNYPELISIRLCGICDSNGAEKKAL